jgi:hypothetical protein
VTLEFEDGARLAISSSGDGQFRTLLRSCQKDAAFRAVGGDDLDGEPRVAIRVLDPPDVTGVAVRIEPPAYSGLAAELSYDRDVEVLRGSRLTIVARPEPPEARGQVRLLPEDRVLALEERPFPTENPEDSPSPAWASRSPSRTRCATASSSPTRPAWRTPIRVSSPCAS